MPPEVLWATPPKDLETEEPQRATAAAVGPGAVRGSLGGGMGLGVGRKGGGENMWPNI